MRASIRMVGIFTSRIRFDKKIIAEEELTLQAIYDIIVDKS
jgi:hypothetical protein